VKAHNDNLGNELADQLAKETACDNSLQTTYHKYPKSAVIRELKCLGAIEVAERMGQNKQRYLNKNLPDDKRQTNQPTTNEPKPIDGCNWTWEIKVQSAQI
jgi:hypothetical protein